MKKILLIQTAFLGDVVLATAIIEKLRQQEATSRIDFLVRKGNEMLLVAHPIIHKLYIWDKQQHKYANLFAILKQIRAEKYDIVINLQRFFTTGLLTTLANADKTIGFKNNPLSIFFSERYQHEVDKNKHEVERNQSLIAAFAGEKFAMPRLYPTPTQWEKTKQYKTKPYICIAPTSVWFTKQYPAAGWVALINALPTGLHIYLLGANNDLALCEQIAQKSNKIVEVLCGKLNLLESAALMADATMNYVNDSAPLHLASALNAPVCAVFCSTVPSFGFTPLSEKSYIVQTEEKLACRPCGLHGYKECPEKHFHCASTIKTAQLLAVLPKESTENIGQF
jgi:lipopolysaccharide heptosyltransferase II